MLAKLKNILVSIILLFLASSFLYLGAIYKGSNNEKYVGIYLKVFKQLPSNYIKKTEALKLGWIPFKGNLQKVKKNAVIGGDKFFNWKKQLPKDKWYEADINYVGGRRNAERLVYSIKNKKVKIYITKDHYKNLKRFLW